MRRSMRMVLIVLALGLLASCNRGMESGDLGGCSDAAMPDCGPLSALCWGGDWICEGQPPREMGGCEVDAAGTPLQICGQPDFGYSPELCRCIGDQ